MIDAAARIVAGHARIVLIAGLVLGLSLPGLAQAVRPLVWSLVITLLFLTVLRLGPAAFALPRGGRGRALGLTATLQIACPVAAFVVLAMAGVAAEPLSQGIVLILAAAPIVGAAPITLMTGGAPELALRQTVLGTLLLPLTSLPVLLLIPAFGTVAQVAGAALSLLLAIGLAGGAAMALRHVAGLAETPVTLARIDAATAVLLGLVVIGLMASAAHVLRTDPAHFAMVLALVMALVFGLQALAARLWPDAREAIAVAVVSGNRNAALFIGVVPAAMADEIFLIIGCYQIPMYLTPLVLPRLLTRGR